MTVFDTRSSARSTSCSEVRRPPCSTARSLIVIGDKAGNDFWAKHFDMALLHLMAAAGLLSCASAFQGPPSCHSFSGWRGHSRPLGPPATHNSILVQHRDASGRLACLEGEGGGERSPNAPIEIPWMERRKHLQHGLWASAGLLATAPASARSLPGGARLSDMHPNESQDVIHPASLLGLWECERVVKVVEGDAEQAELVWHTLGGSNADTFVRKKGERFATRFVAAPQSILSEYTFEGDALDGVILDRGFELAKRNNGVSVEWNANTPGYMKYERGPGGATELVVVRAHTSPLHPICLCLNV